jgi:ureidoglycolate lyase
MAAQTRQIPVVQVTRENVADYGVLIGTDVPHSGLPIPYYKGSVEEGYNLPFAYTGRAVIRMARIRPRAGKVDWLERHLRMTQLFVGLGDARLAMVLGKPTHARGLAQPDLEDLMAFVFPPGHGILLHAGTWHDFPMAIDRPVTVLTANSEEIITALAAQTEPAEIDGGDVHKIDVEARIGVALHVSLA